MSIEMRKLVVILGVPIDDLDMPEALDRVEEFIREGRACGKGHQIATVNVDFIVNAMHDAGLRQLLQSASLAIPDGMPLVWGARLLGVPLRERVAGADLVPALAGRAAQKGYSIFFFGGAEGIAARAAAVLQAKNPGLKIAGVLSPPYAPVENMGGPLLDEISSARPDILLVALGNPKQETWIGLYGKQLAIPVMIGVGGSFDFIAGHTRRAPLWMQRVGLEWVYRLMQEPRRLLRRYMAGLVVFSTFFARQWWAMRRGDVPGILLPWTDLVLLGNKAVVSIQGRLTISTLQSFRRLGRYALSQSSSLVINLRRAEFLDSAAIGALVELAKLVEEKGGQLSLAEVPPEIHHILKIIRLDSFFTIYPDINSALETAPHDLPAQSLWRRSVGG
jgi:N-acetylglucosaminyldiphosphoundecaprenol N-acetyl-beta-D-mannosaminyltransferase